MTRLQRSRERYRRTKMCGFGAPVGRRNPTPRRTLTTNPNPTPSPSPTSPSPSPSPSPDPSPTPSQVDRVFEMITELRGAVRLTLTP